MKIVHICMTQYSNGWTYQENLLAKYHHILGYDVSVITSKYCYEQGKLIEDDKSSFIDVNQVKVIRLPKKQSLFNKLPTYEGFYSTLCDEKPDIIFSHSCQYRDTINLVKYIKEHSDTKLYVDNHADFSNSATNFISLNILHKVVWKYYAKKLVPYTQKFWGVLPARVDFLSTVYGVPKEKCELLVMGADDDVMEKYASSNNITLVRKQYGIKEDDFLIVTGGKIDKAKMQTVLLMKAVKAIKNEHLKLIVFGSIEAEIKEQVCSLVDDVKVIYAGWISPEESYSYFGAADLVVFPGRHSVFWEQVAGQGKPMICKRWPGTEHVDLGGNVLFIDNESLEELVKLIEEISANTMQYEAMKKVAENKAKQLFSYRRIAQESIEQL